MIKRETRLYRRIETAAMLVVFAAMLMPFLDALSQQAAMAAYSWWHLPAPAGNSPRWWSVLLHVTRSGGTIVALGVSAVGVFARKLRMPILVLLVVYMLCVEITTSAILIWALQNFRSAWQRLPSIHGVALVTCYVVRGIGYVILPLAMYRFLRSMPRRNAEAAGAGDRSSESSGDPAYHDVRRFVQYVLVASSIAILANGLVPIIDAFLMSNTPANWFSPLGAKFAVSAAIRVIWPICLVYIAVRCIGHSTNIAKLVRWLLVIDVVRFLALMVMHTRSLLLGVWYPPPAWYDPSLYTRLWAVFGASLTWMVLIVLAMLPYRWLGDPTPTCAVCGYSLRGLQSDRCPECGKPFALRAASA